MNLTELAAQLGEALRVYFGMGNIVEVKRTTSDHFADVGETATAEREVIHPGYGLAEIKGTAGNGTGAVQIENAVFEGMRTCVDVGITAGEAHFGAILKVQSTADAVLGDKALAVPNSNESAAPSHTGAAMPQAARA